MKKLFTMHFFLAAFVGFLLLASGLTPVLGYTPPPGLDSPDQYDFGGQTVTLFVHNTMQELFDTFEPGGTRANRLQEAEELFNAQIELLPVGTVEYAETKMSRILAGDSVRDIIITTDRLGYWPLIRDGLLYPVSEFLPDEYYNEYLNEQDNWATSVLAHGGVRYGFGSHTHSLEDLGQPMFDLHAHGLKRVGWYNKSMLEREGLPDLQELYWDGEWTFDKMREIVEAATRDTSGDGEIDQWGLNWVWNNFVKAYVVANGGNFTRVDEDGRVVFGFDTPEAHEAINFLADIKLDGLEAPSSSFIGGKAALEIPTLATYGSLETMTAEHEDQVRLIPMPRGPRADEHISIAHSVSQTSLAINAEDPEALVALTDFLFRPDDPFDLAEFVESAVPSRDCLAILRDIVDKWQGHHEGPRRTEFDSIVMGAVNRVWAGEMTAEAAMAEIQPEAQAALDDIFGQ